MIWDAFVCGFVFVFVVAACISCTTCSFCCYFYNINKYKIFVWNIGDKRHKKWIIYQLIDIVIDNQGKFFFACM